MFLGLIKGCKTLGGNQKSFPLNKSVLSTPPENMLINKPIKIFKGWDLFLLKLDVFSSSHFGPLPNPAHKSQEAPEINDSEFFFSPVCFLKVWLLNKRPGLWDV